MFESLGIIRIIIWRDMYLYAPVHSRTRLLLSINPPFRPPDQLYFAILKQKIRSTADRHCFCVDDELAYEK